MKNKIIISFVIVLSSISLMSCNKQIIDTHYSFNKAIITGIGEVEISSWTDYDNSDSVQITTKDGITYYTHLNNVILIKDN